MQSGKKCALELVQARQVQVQTSHRPASVPSRGPVLDP
jgi:hypothetical protein